MNLFVTWHIIIFLYIRLRQNLNLSTCHKKGRRGGRKIRKSYPSLIIPAAALIYYSKEFSKPPQKKTKQKKIFTTSSTDTCTDFLYYQYESFGIPCTNNIWLIILTYRQPIIAFSLKRSREKMASILVAFDSFSWKLKHIQWWSSLAFDLARDVYFLIPRNPGIY